MVKIALDAGHGLNTAGKRTPSGEREWTFNSKVLLACVAKLNAYENVQILRLDDPTGKTDVPLKTRTDKANNWKADVLVSIHHNALNSQWGSHGGVETHVQQGSSKVSMDIAKIIQPRITKAMGLRDRGIKISNLHMNREAKSPSLLCEGGFMDSTTDIPALRNDAKLKVQGEAIAEGLAAYFKLKLKAKTPVTPNKPKEETVRLFKPSSPTFKQEVVSFLEKARKAGVFSSTDWETKAKNGTLSLDDLSALIAAYLSRTIK